jgi:predicted PurR-regulated permease PerM
MSDFTDLAEQISRDEGPEKIARDSFERRIFRGTVIVLATITGSYLLWLLVDLLLLLFACALVSLILLTLTNAVRRRTPLPFGAALMLSVVAVIALIAGVFTFFSTTMQAEFTEFGRRLPAAWSEIEGQLRTSPAGTAMLEHAQKLVPTGQALVNAATTTLAALGGAVSGVAIVLIGGLYLAAQPKVYVGGLLRLFPDRSRPQVAETLDAVTVSLRNWLKGQALGMLFVGFATGLGLWLAGLPGGWAIGLIAGVAEFVPYLGILVAVIPATVLAFGQSTETGLWTIAILIAVQQLQGNLVMPLLQNRMVDLPPAVTIFGIVAAGILFGIPGVLLATPLTIVVLVLVRRLYLHEEKQEVLTSAGDRRGPPSDAHPPGN